MIDRRRNEDRDALAAAAAGNAKTIDESGATQPFLFNVKSQSGLFEVTEKGKTDGTTQTFTGISDLTIVGTIFADTFKVDFAAIRDGATVRLDGEAGTDTLSADFSTISAKFLVNNDGRVDSDLGTFANFESYAFTFSNGTSVIRTGSGADSFTVAGGNPTIDAGAGDDVFTTYSAARGFDLDGGAGADTWIAGIAATGTPSMLALRDGTFTLNDRSTVTGVETANVHVSGRLEFNLDGKIGAEPLRVALLDSKSIDATLDLSDATESARVSVTGTIGHDFYSENFGFSAEVGPQVSITAERAVGLTAIGTMFDDAFFFNFVAPFDSLTVSLDGGAGTDFLYVDAVGDTYYYDRVPSTRFVVADDGTIKSSLYNFANFEQFEIVAADGSYVVTGALDDKISGGGLLFGKGGDDVLTGTFDGAVLDGGNGNDTLNGNGTSRAGYLDATSGVIVSVENGAHDTGGAGTDTFRGIAGLVGSAFDDMLTGDERNNVLDGAGGDDTLIGAGGTDTASYTYADAGVTVSLALATRQDTIGAGRDLLSGFENLTGSSFDDVLGGDAGNNVLDGGVGDDKVSFAAASGGVTVDLRITGPQATGSGVGSDTLVSIEGVIGSNFDDVINGDFRDNVIEGGASNDRLDGTTGFDTASYANATAGVTVGLRSTGAQDTLGAGIDTLLNFEALTGSAFDDMLDGDRNDNRLDGGAGNDRLSGGFGSDELIGGTGKDVASYNTGSWADYSVERSGKSYTVTSLANPATDTLSGIEFVEFAGVRFAIGRTVNVGPRAVADTVGVSGEADGNVLANDRDANLADPRLGETLTVTGAIAGRGAVNAFEGSTTLDGRFGTLTLSSDGHFTYDVDADAAGRTGRDVFRYEVTDAHGASSTTTLTLTLDGSGAATIDPWGL